MRSVPTALVAALVLTLSSCASQRGLIFTHTVRPLTTNLHETPVMPDEGKADVKQFDYAYVRVLWGANGIADIAKANGFREVYYADLETLSVLGIWTQQWALVYGSR